MGKNLSHITSNDVIACQTRSATKTTKTENGEADQLWLSHGKRLKKNPSWSHKCDVWLTPLSEKNVL